MHLILASRSPRRQELLRNAGFDFEVCASNAEELRRASESAEGFACRVASDKARVVAAAAAPGSLVLGADTVVAIAGEILGKPTSRDDAARILRLLAGRTHRVITGVCLVSTPDRIEGSQHAVTEVTFRPLDDRDIRDYIESGEAMDKAGAYGIQGLASKFVTGIKGCYFNVVGLPIPLVYEMLKPFLAGER